MIGETFRIADETHIDRSAILTDTSQRLRVATGVQSAIEWAHLFEFQAMVACFQFCEQRLFTDDLRLQGRVQSVQLYQPLQSDASTVFSDSRGYPRTGWFGDFPVGTHPYRLWCMLRFSISISQGLYIPKRVFRCVRPLSVALPSRSLSSIPLALGTR
jgi:hypothetical protein